MSDATQIPTLAEIYQAKKDVKDINTFTKSSALSFVDSDGIAKLTIAGITSLGLDAVRAVGWNPVGNFTDGCTLENPNDTVTDGTKTWRWDGILPKVITPGSSATPTGNGAFKQISDEALRAEISEVPGLKQLRRVPGVTQKFASLVSGSGFGGGEAIYYPAMSETNHNGGIVWAASAVDAWDDTQADLPALLNYVGSDSGCYVRQGVIEVTPEMFGAVGDYIRSSGLGTSNELPTQYAINYTYSAKIKLLINGDYGYNGIVVIPDNMDIAGTGKASSGLFRLDDDNSRGIIVGTYGPANGPDTPAANGYYSVSPPVLGSTELTLSTISDYSNFTVGDIIGIEGETSVPSSLLKRPNMVTEVKSVSASGAIGIIDPIDDSYTTCRITKLNSGTPSTNAVDCTGKVWPLLVSANTKISSLTITGGSNTGWAAANLSTYNTLFSDITFIGNNCLSGNPVAKTNFENCDGYYTNHAYEFAYYSHDTNVSNVEFYRTGDSGGTNVVAGWCNTGEGGKRINLTNFKLVDLGAADTGLNSVITGTDSVLTRVDISSGKAAIFGSEGSKISDSKVFWTSGSGISGFNNGSISDNEIVSSEITTSGSGVLMSSGTAVLSCQGNNLVSFDGTRRAVDVITLEGTRASNIGYNKTYASKLPVNSSFSQNFPEVSGSCTPVSMSFNAGTVFSKDKIIISAILSGKIGQTVSFYINSSVISSAVLTKNGRFSIDLSAQYDGPGTNRCVYSFDINENGSLLSSFGVNSSVNPADIVSASIIISGMSGGDICVSESSNTSKISIRVF